MKKYLRFEIGDRVLVKAFVGFGAERNKEKVITERVMDRVVLDKPREGDITGAGYRHLGVIHTGGSYYSLEGTEYESGYLEIKKTVFVWKVRFGFLNKEVDVLEEDIIACSGDKIIVNFKGAKKLPIKFAEQPGFTEEYRKILSEESKLYPRDSKGRFCK